MAGRRFSYWIAQTLRAEREAAGIPLRSISSVLDVHERTLERLEDLSEPEKGYGQDIDRYVAAYAYLLGLKDPRELWQRALERWRAEGSTPDFSADLPGARFLRPIREQTQRSAPAPSASERKPAAKGRKPAGR